MPLRLGPLTIPWPGAEAHDPYWESFLGSPAADPRNMVSDGIRQATEGAVAPVKAELHTPEITSEHIKELARFVGAELTAVVRLSGNEDYPFAIVCAVRADRDPRRTPGFGGQVPVQNGLFVAFTLAAYIRELGYRATTHVEADVERLAVAGGLGKLDAEGRLVSTKSRTRMHVTDAVHTDLPLAEDGAA